MDQIITLGHLRGFAYEYGAIARRHFKPFGVKRMVKGDGTVVTAADREINKKFIRDVRRINKKICIVGEEESSLTDSLRRLYQDPIDGTAVFTMGLPLFTTMLSLTYDHVPILGVIYDVMSDRMYTAERNKGSFLGTDKGSFLGVSRLSVSKATKHPEPIIGYCSWPATKTLPRARFNLPKVCDLLESQGAYMVQFASIGLMETLVANGELDGLMFPGVGFHDTIPGDLLVREAGGIVTDIWGEPQDYSKDEMDGHIMAGSKEIHTMILNAVLACN